jgi:hypothetical protein
MLGRHILEGVVILHETIHELQRKKRDGVLLKIDFEKAYDKGKWSFLQQTLRMKGFNPKWCDCIENFVEKESVGIRVNNDIGGPCHRYCLIPLLICSPFYLLELKKMVK